ncbi:hypothetical protein B0H17DRAFT_1130291 [Mycena rosella]|uniref:Uncharacterized protein n=1 Tax=Mycena rosella TaxID=1033263 RepID=A0AAD7DRU6_MYCRO|nr:hypothetical protein B0H17DRAFT_1130291 [Mycena rosella]
MLGEDPSDENFEEILEGIAGGKPDLAALLVKQINLAVMRPLTKRTVGTLTAVLQFLTHLGAPEGPFNVAGMFHGAVKSMFIALIALCAITTYREEYAVVMHTVVMFWISDFREPLGHKYITQAVDGGLFTVIVTLGAMPAATNTRMGSPLPLLEELLTKVLPGAFIYYPVISKLKRSLAAVLPLTNSTAFIQCPLFSLWARFVAFARRRLDAVAARLASLVACGLRAEVMCQTNIPSHHVRFAQVLVFDFSPWSRVPNKAIHVCYMLPLASTSGSSHLCPPPHLGLPPVTVTATAVDSRPVKGLKII